MTGINKRLTVDVSLEEHTAIKTVAARLGISIKDLFREAMKDFVAKARKEHVSTNA